MGVPVDGIAGDGVGLARQDSAGPAQAGDDGGITLGYIGAPAFVAPGADQPCGFDPVFDGEGHPVQRSPALTTGQSLVGRSGLLLRCFGIHLYDGIEARVDRDDARQVDGDHF